MHNGQLVCADTMLSNSMLRRSWIARCCTLHCCIQIINNIKDNDQDSGKGVQWVSINVSWAICMLNINNLRSPNVCIGNVLGFTVLVRFQRNGQILCDIIVLQLHTCCTGKF